MEIQFINSLLNVRQSSKNNRREEKLHFGWMFVTKSSPFVQAILGQFEAQFLPVDSTSYSCS